MGFNSAFKGLKAHCKKKSAIAHKITAGFTLRCYVVLRRNALHEDGEPYEFLSMGLFEKQGVLSKISTHISGNENCHLFRKWIRFCGVCDRYFVLFCCLIMGSS